MGLNPNCDGAHCHRIDGEVRKLPLGSDANHILCEACFNYEMGWRAEENLERVSRNDWPHFLNLPQWEELEVYEGSK